MRIEIITRLIPAIMVALPLGSHAQEEMFPTGMMWKEVIVEEGVIRDSQMITDTLLYHDFEICGDTIIGQKTYKKVMCDGKPYGACIRETDNCVWMKADVYPEEFKLYDFNWYGKESVEVQYLRCRNFKGAEAKLDKEEWYMAYKKSASAGTGQTESLYFPDRSEVIKGLGRVSDRRLNGCLLGYIRLDIDVAHLIFIKVLWVKKNGVLTFHAPSYDVLGITKQQTGLQQPASTVYDLQGRRVPSLTHSHSPLRKGIYIENGRKRVVR